MQRLRFDIEIEAWPAGGSTLFRMRGYPTAPELWLIRDDRGRWHSLFAPVHPPRPAAFHMDAPGPFIERHAPEFLRRAA